jgi:GAF domain-containing protein
LLSVSEADHAIRQSIAALSGFFVGEGTLGETLTRVSDLACESIEAADLAGITMLVEGRARTAVFTDATSPEIDAAQYETGVGPCLDAFRHQKIYRVESTAADARWPAFSAAAAKQGVRSTLSLPLVAQSEGVGALNLYSRDGIFTADDEEVGSVFAAQAAIVLANAKAYWDARHLSEQLSEAMQHRAIIEQAKGVVMAGGGRNADEAFQVLVRASQRENRKLRDIAAQIVEQAQQRPRPSPSRSPEADT